MNMMALMMVVIVVTMLMINTQGWLVILAVVVLAVKWVCFSFLMKMANATREGNKTHASKTTHLTHTITTVEQLCTPPPLSLCYLIAFFGHHKRFSQLLSRRKGGIHCEVGRLKKAGLVWSLKSHKEGI
jgi:hypothetical protein